MVHRSQIRAEPFQRPIRYHFLKHDLQKEISLFSVLVILVTYTGVFPP